jgi:hypothetical protein|nr:MAG TPA: hypothetical protein [Bacteriophage sp.]DAM48145.1 MAG TPA: hypothetical protein [Caudoviricetes sp.]
MKHVFYLSLLLLFLRTWYNLLTGRCNVRVYKKGGFVRMSLYEELSLLYVKKNATPGDSPEKLLAMYREAFDKITKCDKEHGGKAFSFE